MSLGNSDLIWLLSQSHIDTIIDIGANNGEYASFLSRLFGAHTVYAIEPNPAHIDRLKERGFIVYSCALGNHSKASVDFNIYQHDGASSLLHPTNACMAEYPEVRGLQNVRVPLVRLDDLTFNIIPGLLIKIDAQGAEREIIEGGGATISNADILLIEQSFVPLYEGQALFNEVHNLLAELGFELKGVKSQHISNRNGQPLFAHCIYESSRIVRQKGESIGQSQTAS